MEQSSAMSRGGLLRHSTYNLCLDARKLDSVGLTAEVCDRNADTQIWKFTIDANV